jgi:hypothetical protein
MNFVNEKFPIRKFANGEIYFWIEQESSIHIKAAVKNYNDPVEIGHEEAREIAEALLEMADQLKKLDEG